MANNPSIIIGATDDTKGAFASVKRSLGDVQQTAGSLKTTLAALAGTAVVASLAASTREAINYADGLGKLSQKAGLSAEALAGLVYAGKLADVSQDSLAAGMRALNKEIANGGETLKQLGISTKDSSGNLRGAEKVLADVADVISQIDDENPQKAALAMKLLGKSGAELIPLLNGGSQALRESAEEAQRFGLVLDKDATKQAEQFNDNVTRLAESLRGEFVQGIQPAIGYLATLSEALVQSKQSAKDATGGFNLMGEAIKVIAQTISVVASDVKFVFAGVGKEIGGIAAQIAALARGDLAGFNAISKAMKEDASRARAELDKFQADVFKPSGKDAGGGRGFINPDLVKPQGRTVADSVFGGAASTAQGANAAAQLISQLTKEYRNLSGEATRYQDVLEQVNLKTGSFTAAQRKEVLAIAASIDAKKNQIEANKLIDASIKSSIDANEALNNSYIDSGAALRAFQALQGDAVRVYGMTEEAVRKLRFEEDLRNLVIASETAVQDRLVAGLIDEAQARRELLDIANRERDARGTFESAETKRKVVDQDKKDREAATQRTDRISQSVADGLMNGFSKGQSFADIFLQELKSEFSRTVLMPTIRPVMDSVFGSGGLFEGLFKGLGSGGGFAGLFPGLTGPSGGFGTGSGFGNLDLAGFFASFEGGGYTGSGSRSGGLDGKGGYMAMLHPNETVIDHVKGGSGGAVASFSPVTNINITGANDQQSTARLVGQAIKANNEAWRAELRAARVI